jgi:hypothetical protein
MKYSVGFFRKVNSTRFASPYKVEESVNMSFGDWKDAVARARKRFLAGNG